MTPTAADVILEAEQLLADPCLACGHGRLLHTHHRSGTDCSYCQCDHWTPPASTGWAWTVGMVTTSLTAWGALGTLAWRHWA